MTDINAFMQEYKDWSLQDKFKDFGFITKISDKRERKLLNNEKFNLCAFLLGPLYYFGSEMYFRGVFYTIFGIFLLCLLQHGLLWGIPYLLFAFLISLRANKIYLKHLEKIRKVYADFDPDADTSYFNISTPRLVILSLLTGGFYLVYWHYRNMKALKICQKDDVYPFWSAVFAGLTSYNSFRAISHSAKLLNYHKKFKPALTAWLFFFFYGGVNYRALSDEEVIYFETVLAVVIMGWLFAILLTLIVCNYQKAIHFYCEAMGLPKVKGYTFWEIILILLGLIGNSALFVLTYKVIMFLIFAE